MQFSSQSPVSQSSDVTAPPNCTTQLEALCVCLERVGDNGPCPVHGKVYARGGAVKLAVL
jgi:hypothetical protein